MVEFCLRKLGLRDARTDPVTFQEVSRHGTSAIRQPEVFKVTNFCHSPLVVDGTCSCTNIYGMNKMQCVDMYICVQVMEFLSV